MLFPRSLKTIVHVRHPQCLHNVAYDQAIANGIRNQESPLTDVGREQCRITAIALKRKFGQFDFVVASMYTRTHAIPDKAGYVFGQSSYLDERSQGIWHTHGRARCAELYPEERERFKTEGFYHYRAPDGESCPDVEERIKKFFASKAIFVRRNTQKLLISGHGTAGLCLRKVLTNASVEDWHSWDRIRNAAFSVYERVDDESFRCVVFNEAPWLGLLEEGSETNA